MKLPHLRPDNYQDPNYLGSIFRKRRLAHFRQLISSLSLPAPVRILDLGGTVEFWERGGFAGKADTRITLVNKRPQHSPFSNIDTITTDIFSVKPEQGRFQVIFANSLIEHLFSFDAQCRFAEQVMQWGPYHFIQTPYKYFPIEPHFKLPLFQFMPKHLQIWLQTRTSLVNGQRYSLDYAERILKEIRLLSYREMQQLFPQSRIEREYLAGLTKSLIATNLPPTGSSK